MSSAFRYPFTLPKETHPQVEAAIKNAFNGILDLNQAMTALNEKVAANSGGVKTVTETVTAISSSVGSVAAVAASASRVLNLTSSIGSVNLQPNLTPGAYTLSQSDYGGLILVNSSIAFALTLNSGLTLPFFTTVYNFGAGLITATPDVGLVNNAASVPIATTHFATIYFDPTRNFWALVT